MNNGEMECPDCNSTHVTKNGHRRGKQNYHCQSCGRQFVASYSVKGYTAQVKRHCLILYVNGMGFRAIEHGSVLGRRILPKNFRCTGVNHNTVIQWVKQSGEQLADAPESQMIPELAQIDELQTFVGSKNTKSGSRQQSMGMKQESELGFWVIAVQPHKRQLWLVWRCWKCFLYITDGYPVYQCFIDEGDHLVSKLAMTRVEGDEQSTTALQAHDYIARLSVIPSPRRCCAILFAYSSII